MDLKHLKSKIVWFLDGSVLCVAMATRHRILQRTLFLNRVIQELLFMYDDKIYLYQSTQVVICFTSKHLNESGLIQILRMGKMD